MEPELSAYKTELQNLLTTVHDVIRHITELSNSNPLVELFNITSTHRSDQTQESIVVACFILKRFVRDAKELGRDVNTKYLMLDEQNYDAGIVISKEIDSTYDEMSNELSTVDAFLSERFDLHLKISHLRWDKMWSPVKLLDIQGIQRKKLIKCEHDTAIDRICCRSSTVSLSDTIEWHAFVASCHKKSAHYIKLHQFKVWLCTYLMLGLECTTPVLNAILSRRIVF